MIKRSVNIFGKVYPIVREDILTTQQNLGLFDYEKIIIDLSLSGTEETVTEIHEFIHAVATRTGLDLTSIHPDVWELICENVARALVENYIVTPIMNEVVEA